MSIETKASQLEPVSFKSFKTNDEAVNMADAFYEDPDGNVQVSQIEVLHALVHAKKMYTISSRHDTPQNGKHSILITAGAKDIHLRIGYSSEDFAFFNTYSNVVPTGGSAYPAFNRFVGSAANTPLYTVLKNITSFTGGQVRGQDFVGKAGVASQRAGGTGASDIETIIPAGSNLLIELQRVDSGNAFTGIICNLYERSPL